MDRIELIRTIQRIAEATDAAKAKGLDSRDMMKQSMSHLIGFLQSSAGEKARMVGMAWDMGVGGRKSRREKEDQGMDGESSSKG